MRLKTQLSMLLNWIDDEVPIRISVTAPGRHGAFCDRE